MRVTWRLAGPIALLATLGSVWALHAGASDIPTPAATSQAKELAAQVAAASGDLAPGLRPIEDFWTLKLISSLGLEDATASAKVKEIMHDGLSLASRKAADAVVNAYATRFPPSQLKEILAFLTGPGGTAEKANLPLLKADLSAALTLDQAGIANAKASARRDLSNASPLRREVITRIFKAQDSEARTRLGYDRLAKLGQNLDPTLANGDKQALSTQTESAAAASEQRHEADEYVYLVMAVETHFYATHYTDAELAIVADYLESKAGQAAVASTPVLQRAASQALKTQLSVFLSTLDASVCSAISCNGEQRTKLTKEASAFREMLNAFPK